MYIKIHQTDGLRKSDLISFLGLVEEALERLPKGPIKRRGQRGVDRLRMRVYMGSTIWVSVNQNAAVTISMLRTVVSLYRSLSVRYWEVGDVVASFLDGVAKKYAAMEQKTSGHVYP